MQIKHDSVHTFSSTKILSTLFSNTFPIVRRTLVVACLVATSTISMPVATLQAAVETAGHVTPVDTFISPNIDEGLPPGGNFLDPNQVGIDPNTGVITDFFNQITWEGYVSQASNLGAPTPVIGANTNAHVYVGASEFQDALPGTGNLQINSGSELRFMDLIIGGNTNDPELPTPSAHGTVIITGPGSLYNSDYNLIPPEAVPLLNSPLFGPDSSQISVNARENETDAVEGFDLRLGVSALSTGVLSISAGGVAEIHDSVVVGEAVGSVGIVTVDGIGSVLQGGSADVPLPTQLGIDPHMMIIGKLGNGTLNITNGGRVIAKDFEQEDNIAEYRAAIGDNPLFLGSNKGVSDSPRGGGSGTVNVDGSGSLWSVNGGLLVGGFSQADNTPNSNDFDVEGNDVRYGSTVGDGTLNVTNGGQVTIVTPPTGGSTGNLLTNLSIGRFGRLVLNDGRVSVGNPSSRNENVVLTNDGKIEGHGLIETGIFRNRLLGEVSVSQDEKLTIVSGSGFDLGDLGVTPILEELPLLNYGVIHVDQGEIEFLRAEDGANQNPGGGGLGSGDPARFQPFRNAAITTDSLNPIFSQRVGEIKSNNSTLNFQTGLENQGRLVFYGGNNNILFGDVLNRAADVDLITGVPEGKVLITGDETFVTFNGNFTNEGYLEVGPTATGFQVVGDLTTTATSRIVSRLDSAINVLGAATLEGTFQVELPLPGEVAIDLTPGNVFPIFFAGEGLTETLLFDLPFIGLAAGFIPLVDTVGGTIELLAFDVALTTGGDINGDGIVDDDDIAIYSANRGNPGGLGDINGDGIVNALDLQIIFNQLGGPGFITAVAQAVPEPASATLLLLALVAMAGPRRRR